jgi:hypothetical protein
MEDMNMASKGIGMATRNAMRQMEQVRKAARKEAMDMQQAWDKAAAAMGREFVDGALYGVGIATMGQTTMDVARAEDATRTMDAAHDAARGFDYRLTSMAREIESARKSLAEFAAKLVDPVRDPNYEMRWADGAFEAAATVTVLNWVLPSLRKNGPQKTMKMAQQEVMRGARSRPSSTSAASNLSEACVTEQWAKMAESLGYYL